MHLTHISALPAFTLPHFSRPLKSALPHFTTGWCTGELPDMSSQAFQLGVS